MLVYYKSFYCQYRVRLVGEPTYVEGTYTRFGLTIKSRQAILRFEYPNGIQASASIEYFSENKWPDMPVGYNSF